MWCDSCQHLMANDKDVGEGCWEETEKKSEECKWKKLRLLRLAKRSERQKTRHEPEVGCASELHSNFELDPEFQLSGCNQRGLCWSYNPVDLFLLLDDDRICLPFRITTSAAAAAFPILHGWQVPPFEHSIMSLDAALFTLHFVRRRTEPWIVDIYSGPAAPGKSTPPPVPAKDSHEATSSSGSAKPTPFSGTIPDLAAQRALVLESNDFSKLTPIYTRVRATNHTQYSTILLDGLVNDCLLASISQPYTNRRKKQMQLYRPDAELELEKRTKTFQQAWLFHFGDAASQHVEEFSWKREGGPSRGSSTQSAYVCEVIRRPDPNVLAAQYRPPAAKGKPGTLQLMDYNLDRLDLQDKKGLEVALVMTLSALLDQEYDERIASRGEPNLYICSNGIPADLSTQGYSSAWQEVELRQQASTVALHGHPAAAAPSHAGAPPQMASMTDLSTDVADIDRIADLEPNEILVSKWGSVDEYIQHAIHLLRCDEQGQSMYLIVLLSDSVETTSKVIQIAAAIKAAYYRLPDDAKGTVYGRPAEATAIEDELYQYVQTLDEEPTLKQGPESSPAETTPRRRIIKLDPPSSNTPSGSQSISPTVTPYRPPSKLKIILSKERIGELEPKKAHDPSPSASHSTKPGESGSISQTRLDVPQTPALPGRPTSPAHSPASQQHMESQPHDKVGKGKALLTKLGLHQ